MSENDEVMDLFELWADHMGTDAGVNGWPERVPILASEAARDSEQLYAAADRRLAGIVAAIVDSLAPHEQSALFRRFGLANVFRYPRMKYSDVLHDAICHARLLCAKRGLLSAQYRRRITADGDVRPAR